MKIISGTYLIAILCGLLLCGCDKQELNGERNPIGFKIVGCTPDETDTRTIISDAFTKLKVRWKTGDCIGLFDNYQTPTNNSRFEYKVALSGTDNKEAYFEGAITAPDDMSGRIIYAVSPYKSGKTIDINGNYSFDLRYQIQRKAINASSTTGDGEITGSDEALNHLVPNAFMVAAPFAVSVDPQEAVRLNFKHVVTYLQMNIKLPTTKSPIVTKVTMRGYGDIFAQRINVPIKNQDKYNVPTGINKSNEISVGLEYATYQQNLTAYMALCPITFDSGKTLYFDIYTIENGVEYKKYTVSKVIASSGMNLQNSKCYRMNFDLTSMTPVTAAAPHSNCYILPPSTELLIPVSRANDIVSLGMSENKIQENDLVSVELVWKDASGELSSSNIINTITVEGKGANAYIRVKAGSKEGNAVIAAKVNSEIRWSWHIWVSNYKPDVSNYDSGTGFKVMTLNLGAKNVTISNSYELYGLTYQWGRKDPFPSFGSTSSNDIRTIYDGSGSAVTTDRVAISLSNPIRTAIRNPLKFYYCSQSEEMDNSEGWLGNVGSEAAFLGADMWGVENSASIHKTIYDPCPIGWRVPYGNNWSGINTATFPYNNSYNGLYSSTYKVLYPFASYRIGYNYYSDYNPGRNDIAYWNADLTTTSPPSYPTTKYPNRLYLSNGGINVQAKNPSMGFYIRCVKDNSYDVSGVKAPDASDHYEW